MIRLTRLRQTQPFYLNPDLIERVERNHDTTVHLSNGTEYVVSESPEDIVEQVLDFRARTIGTASRFVPMGMEAP